MNHRILLLLILALWPVAIAQAYPPAPGVSIYGLVRDQFGWALRYNGAEIVFKAGSHELARHPIRSDVKFSENFRVLLPVDSDVTRPYKPGAVAESAVFTVEIQIDGETYYPVETFLGSEEQGQDGVARRGYSLPEPGTAMRLDFTLGTDADGDGLPDEWERWQLEQAGLDTGRLDHFSADGDADKDGASDREEFHAGTSPSSPDGSIWMDVVKYHQSGFLELKYFGLKDKAYLVEMSDDGETWGVAPVFVGLSETPKSAWVSDQTGEEFIFAPVDVPVRIFRLRVR